MGSLATCCSDTQVACSDTDATAPAPAPTLLTALAASTADTHPVYQITGLVTYGKCVAIYDGDTAHFTLVVDGQIRRYVCRLYGYDAPEMKPPLADPDREAKKARAVAARDRLWALVADGAAPGAAHSTLVRVRCRETDKYGRLLIEVYPRDTAPEAMTWDASFNAAMIRDGHGYAYTGGTKRA